VEVGRLGLVDARALAVAAHEVDHCLQVVHGRHGVRRARGVGQVGAHERHPVADLGLDPLALAVDDPRERAAVPGVEQLAYDRAAEGTGTAGHEDGHVRSSGAGATPRRRRLSRPGPVLPWRHRWSRPR
jgi:hypothetical protein